MPMTKFYRQFDGVEALLAYNTAALDRGARAFEPWRTHGHDWVGRRVEDWPDVCALAGAAWPEGLATIEGMIRELSDAPVAAPVSCQRRPRWSADGGDEVDHDRLRAGQDCWRALRRESAKAPRTLAVVVQVGAPASYAAETLFWPGAAAVALADLLENAGDRVEVWGVSSSVNERNDPGCFHAVCLKAAQAPLDLATLTNAVGGWFIRTAWYQTRWSEAGYQRPNAGRGGVMATLRDDPDLVQRTVGDVERILVEDIWSREAALELVRRVVSGLAD
jgi:hypothetical protein